jgi:polysaccharide export outer membrane protein
MEELSNHRARVSGEGTITLPLVGVVPVAGLTEQQTREEIRRRLAERYMYDPQVNLFVREYRSRQVAVIGAVNKPGLYNLASEANTLLDMISQAGGMTDTAASRILFIPGEPGEERQAKELAAVLPAALSNRDSSLTVKRLDPIVIDLQYLHQGGQQIYLTLPAKPGDVIIVPASGEVLVEGWVKTPASYKISPGMTVLGAVAAAGGLLFAADTDEVKVLRTGRGGEKILLSADMEKIKRGESPDIPVEAGDVIEVSFSNLKIVPYSVYSTISNLVRIGAYTSIY